MSFKEEQDQEVINQAAPLRVIKVNPQTDSRWLELVRSLPDGIIHHHPAWLQVIEEAFNYTPTHLACEDTDGQLRAILPLFLTRSLLSGRRLSSLPRTPVAGPLASDEYAMVTLLDAAVKQTRELAGTQLQIKMLSNTLDGLVSGVIGIPWRQTYVVELPERPDLLRIGNSRNHARIKWSVNKAIKSGVEIHSAESERELRAWYALYLDTMRRVAVPPRPYRFFEIAWRILQPLGLMRLLLASQYEAGQVRLLAGSLFLMSGQTVFYAFTGWRREALSLRPNDALHWHAIHQACEEGFRHYDLGEVSKDNRGLSDFKSKWNAEAVWLYRYYFPAPREMEIDILESESRLSQIANATWQKLPIKATVILSNLAHRYF